MKRLLASFCAFAFLTALLCTTTGCPDNKKTTPTKTSPTEKSPTEKTKST